NDWFHTGYAVGGLPTAYANTNFLPAFAGGSLVWGLLPGGAAPSNTPTSAPPTFQPPTNPPTAGPSATPTLTNAATNTFTPPPSAPPVPSDGLVVQIKNNGTDNNQQTIFAFSVRNTGTSAVSVISVRVYFTLDGSNPASNYSLEKYYDQSGVAAVSAPTQ